MPTEMDKITSGMVDPTFPRSWLYWFQRIGKLIGQKLDVVLNAEGKVPVFNADGEIEASDLVAEQVVQGQGTSTIGHLAMFADETATLIEDAGAALPDPSDTVVTETSYGQASTAGTSTDYSRGDHTHGTPDAPDLDDLGDVTITDAEQGDMLQRGASAWINTHHGDAGQIWTCGGDGANNSWEDNVQPSDSVEDETSWGITPDAGTSDEYSRADHTHGTPADPTTSAAGSDTYVQFNDGGTAFGGDSGLVYNKTTDELKIGGKLGVGEDPLAVGHFRGSDAGAVQVFIKNANGGTSSSAELVFGTYTSAIPTGTGNPGPQGRIACINTDSGSAYSDLALSTYGALGGSPGSSEILRITNTGRLGILTASPSTDVALGGATDRTLAVERHASDAGSDLTLSAGGAKAGTTDKAGGDLLLKSGIATGTGSSSIKLYTAPADSGTGSGDRDATLKATLTGTGWLGHGVATPLSKLHIYDEVTGSLQIFLHNGKNETNNTTDLVFGLWSSATPNSTPAPQAKISVINTDSGSAYSDIAISAYGSAGLSEIIRVKNTKRVGILTNNPSCELDVNGDVNIASGKTYNINGSPHSHGDTYWPIGSVFLAVVATDPATLLGFGTWARIAEGQLLAGYKNGDADFGTVEGTGGAKTVTVDAHAAHTHDVDVASTTSGEPSETTAVRGGTGYYAASPTHTHAVDPASVTSGNPSASLTHAEASILPPYVVVYAWKRTA